MRARQNDSYDKFVYFELDMIILPGAGEHVHDTFDRHKHFDVAYTYRNPGDPLIERNGSMNTGVILYRRTAAMFGWLSAVTSATFQLVQTATESGPVIEGGHNQLAIDSLGAAKLRFGASYTHPATNACNIFPCQWPC